METDTIAALVFGTAFFGFLALLLALYFKAHPYEWTSFAERRRLRDHHREQWEKWVTNNPEKHKLSKTWEHGFYIGAAAGAVIYAIGESVIRHGG